MQALATEEATGTEWGVVRTRTSLERDVAEHLQAQRFEVFVPLEKVWKVRTRRHKCDYCQVWGPTDDCKDCRWQSFRRLEYRGLYPSYLFASWSDEFRRHDVRRTRDVLDILTTRPGEPSIEQFVNSLRIALSTDGSLTRSDWMKRGAWAKVASGPFMGIIGQIGDRRRGGRIMLVGVPMLGDALEVEIGDDELEPWEPPAV